MAIFLTLVHTIVSIGLVGAILLHSGKGTGLSNAFGGGLPTALGGAGVVERNLDRITIVLAVIFVLNTVILGAIV